MATAQRASGYHQIVSKPGVHGRAGKLASNSAMPADCRHDEPVADLAFFPGAVIAGLRCVGGRVELIPGIGDGAGQGVRLDGFGQVGYRRGCRGEVD